MEPYFDLGTYTRGTSTASTSAQTWFDRGLVWSYAFHHEEAIRCFERAVEHDPGVSLAHDHLQSRPFLRPRARTTGARRFPPPSGPEDTPKATDRVSTEAHRGLHGRSSRTVAAATVGDTGQRPA